MPNVTLAVAAIQRTLPPASPGARSRLDGVFYGTNHVNDFPAWPRPMITDAEGRFTLRGLGRGLAASLSVHHPRFARGTIPVETTGTSESKSMTAALEPAQTLTGRVTYADTGEGVPHAVLEVMSSRGRVALLSQFETDAEGRFRVNPPHADQVFNIKAFPPEGQPYLTARTRVEWPKAALEQTADLALPRGVLIRGRVTEEGSGKPVTGATVDFVTHAERPNREKKSIVLETAADGSFQLGADSSPGHLFIKGPSDDYVLQAIGYQVVQEGQPGGPRWYAHAFKFLDLKPGIGSQEVQMVVRRGATVTGQVVGPDGQPIRDAWIFSRVILDPRRGAWRSWTGRSHGNVHSGRFEVHGLDPDTEVPVYFLEPKRKLGGMVNLSGKSATGTPVTVRLEPCGAARARVVGPDGKPVAGRLPRRIITMVVTPGPPFNRAGKAGLLAADETDLNLIDPVNYEKPIVSDADGRVTLPVLIPGATYRFTDITTAREPSGPQIRKEFTVKAGETLDLGDIRIEKLRPR